MPILLKYISGDIMDHNSASKPLSLTHTHTHTHTHTQLASNRSDVSDWMPQLTLYAMQWGHPSIPRKHALLSLLTYFIGTESVSTHTHTHTHTVIYLARFRSHLTWHYIHQDHYQGYDDMVISRIVCSYNLKSSLSKLPWLRAIAALIFFVLIILYNIEQTES